MRRPIRELILRELSFSGQAMTAAQIAKAINYIPERTETALERMAKDGQVVRNEAGRWAIGLAGTPQINAHGPGVGNGKLPAFLERFPMVHWSARSMLTVTKSRVSGSPRLLCRSGPILDGMSIGHSPTSCATAMVR